MSINMDVDVASTRATLHHQGQEVVYYRLAELEKYGVHGLGRLPFTVKILLENVLRQAYSGRATSKDILSLAQWQPGHSTTARHEFLFYPSRVLLQDFTGVPAVADLAAMRSAVARLGGDAGKIHPLIPVDFVIDHSVQVDEFGTRRALAYNVEKEYERNQERYMILRWAQQAFENVRVIPPGNGIVHQINLEYLASVVSTREQDGEVIAFPDTLICTDSHTTMINGLGVLGWGVGGIEAEAVMLGQPLGLQTPEIIGIRLTGKFPEGITATDVVLTVTQMLRKHGVVGKFVEFTGPGLSQLSLADRATISNMSPEFGATATLFPIDQETLQYLRSTGRSEEAVDLVERYTRAQGLFYEKQMPEPFFDEVLELDLSTIEPSLAGPSRPQDRVVLSEVSHRFKTVYHDTLPANERTIPLTINGQQTSITDGSVVIAAITSCTNTSNPAVLIAAGLLAKRAVEKCLSVKPTVKTSLAPGSRVVVDYLTQAQLLPYLEALGFYVVGFGCTTCSGSSGPLPEPVATAIQDNNLVVASVLSGNRNFEGRIHAQVRASFLASPPLVVAYALAGSINIDLNSDPIGQDQQGQNIYLRDIWPTIEEINQVIQTVMTTDMFVKNYQHLCDGDEHWHRLPGSEGELYAWNADSTYIQEPPFLHHVAPLQETTQEIRGARALVVLGDSITTDHISPVGNFSVTSEAGRYLSAKGVERKDFNTYGTRRGNHEVMARGTFGNIRLRNQLLPGKEGAFTIHFPTAEEVSIYEAAQRYQHDATPLIVIAGKEYGCGSSRDWAAKGPALLGIRAVLAESFERIHRSNLVGMGLLPLQFMPGENRETLGLTGTETFDVIDIEQSLQPRQEVSVIAHKEDGTSRSFKVIARLDSQLEISYYQNGGILPYMLRKMMQA